VTFVRIISGLMSHVPEAELQQLTAVTSELREVMGERGYRVDTALSADPAFGSTGRRSPSALTRELAIDAIGKAASQVGIWFGPVNGEGRELVASAAGVTRRYRIRKARKTAAGTFRIDARSDVAEERQDLFGRVEDWVFAYVLDDLYQVQEVFVAQVLGQTEGQPGQLILGVPIFLVDQTPFDGGFTPSTDEELDGFDDQKGDRESGIT
jgi:hypothetical protein